MNISLQEITKENYEDVCDLSVAENQRHLLAANIESIFESKFEDGLTPRAIYCDGDCVGFFMWYQGTQDKVKIIRFMVDQTFQAKGIGRKALNLAIAEIRFDPNIKQIEICYHPENPVAKGFYSSFGFKETGLDDHGEDMLATLTI